MGEWPHTLEAGRQKRAELRRQTLKGAPKRTRRVAKRRNFEEQGLQSGPRHRTRADTPRVRRERAPPSDGGSVCAGGDESERKSAKRPPHRTPLGTVRKKKSKCGRCCRASPITGHYAQEGHQSVHRWLWKARPSSCCIDYGRLTCSGCQERALLNAPAAVRVAFAPAPASPPTPPRSDVQVYQSFRSRKRGPPRALSPPPSSPIYNVDGGDAEAWQWRRC